MIDWWSLGVCAYELIFGRRPFRGRTNPELTYAIGKGIFKFPEDVDSKCSQEGQSALTGVAKSLTFEKMDSYSCFCLCSSLLEPLTKD